MNTYKPFIDQIPASAVTALARSYRVLDHQVNLKAMLSAVLPCVDISTLSKRDMHGLINHIISHRHNGESNLKAMLVDMFIQKDVTAAFEIKINSSRIDFVTINGNSISYEIKSGIDNLRKLSKQIDDYQNVFEYNYVVVDEKHFEPAQEIVPSKYGIYVLIDGMLTRKNIAKKNLFFQPDKQLQLFTKKESQFYFNLYNGDQSEILKECSAANINDLFKAMLKKRYSNKWAFLKTFKNDILPIDYQFFFKHNIHPQIIYCS